MHDLSVIATLGGALLVALVFGWITRRAGQSTLLGYLLAGIAVGPHTPGFVADARLAAQMAEIGVILLMFGVGLHFHPRELLQVKRIAVPGAIAQSAVATAAGWACARAYGWSDGAGIVFGMALAVASTVVLMRMLVEQDRLATREGHVAVGWLIVEDLFTVVALVALPALAAPQLSADALAGSLAIALGKAGVFALLVWGAGTRVVSPLMERIARTRSSELFTLAVFVVALGVALLAAQVFHLSVALGAFFAGLVVGQSRFGPQAAADMAPFRDVFTALFFVSVGMLFDPAFVLAEPLLVLGVLAIVLVAKPLTALLIVRVLRDTSATAWTVAVGLAQIGEFSFILAALGRTLGLLPAQAMDALVVGALVSIAVNPLLFRALRRYETRRAGRSEPQSAPPEPVDRPQPVVVAGMDALGRSLVARCASAGVGVCIVDSELDALDGFGADGVSTVYGDPGRPEILRAAGLAEARLIAITRGTLADKMRVCISARSVNPRVAIVATANGAAERAWLEEFGAAFVCDAMEEVSETLLRSIRDAL